MVDQRRWGYTARPVRSIAAVLAVAAIAALAVGATTLRGDEPSEPRLVTSADFRVSSDTPAGRQIAVEDEAWIATGTDPGAGTQWADMSYWALRDIRALWADHPLPPAGAAPQWGYFWPRDGAFTAMALDRTGHPTEVRQILDGIAALPFDKVEGFDARYTLEGRTVVDRPRGPQSDGCGWVLWAIGSIRANGQTPLPDSTAELRDRCVTHLDRLTSSGTRLPPASPDYWEVNVTTVSLGTVAPMAAGLLAATDDYAAIGEPAKAAAARVTAEGLDVAMRLRFSPDYERFGDLGELDAAITFLMPPFAVETPEVAQKWSDYQVDALRPAGGLAPGAAWKEDGTSWTPETALAAYTAAASGRTDEAAHWLDWLDTHRTPWGSLPEKVTGSALPAGPAPLMWTDALVLLTLAELSPGMRG